MSTANVMADPMSDANPRSKLAAILAADVVGFSVLMGQNEYQTLRNLRACRAIVDEAIRKNHGRIFTTAGDSVLAEFSSPVDAIVAAVEFQRNLLARNGASGEADRMAFRVGLNLGDVIVEGENLYGDGVNVASRVESTCEPGGVTVSAKFYEEVRRKLDLHFEGLGEQQVKNIAERVVTYRVNLDPDAERAAVPTPGVGTVESVARDGRWTFGDTVPVATYEPTPGSIAVLMLKNLSSDPEQQYFCEGVSEDLIGVLARYKSLQVTSSTASFAFSQGEHAVTEIGRKLSVKYVLSGAVRKMGPKVRVSVKLENSVSGQLVWSENFDADANTIFEFEEHLGSLVAARIVGKIESEDIRDSANKPPENALAYDLVLRGLKHHRKGWVSAPDAAQAYALFAEAALKDPKYARAHAWSCCSLANLKDWDPEVEGGEWLSKALDYISTAMDLDPDDAEANRIMAVVLWGQGDHGGSLAHNRRACELCPSDLFLSYRYAQRLLRCCRFEEAKAEMERARRLSPTGSDYIFEIEGILAFWLENYAGSVKMLKQLHSPSSEVLYYLAAATSAGGDQSAAAAMIRKIEQDHGQTVSKFLEEVEVIDPTLQERLVSALSVAVS